MAAIRERVRAILTVEAGDHGLERAVNLFLAGLITLNVASVMLETVESLHRQFGRAFQAFEAFSVVVFGLEYLLRLWSCTTESRYAHPVLGRLKFAMTPLAVVDLVAILPSLVPGGILDLRFGRAVRLLRLSRSLKMVRYSQSLQTLGRVLRAKRHELAVTAFAGLILLVIAASGMYFVERDAQPDTFSSIPAALWWGVVTLTTVGYGDVYPVTVAGRCLASVIAMLGIGLFALPAGILAGVFSEELHRKHSVACCPHCGERLDKAV
jgi:voltage-gated potassium channel